MNTVDGALQSPKDTDNLSADYKLAVVDLFKEGKIPRSKKTAM